MQDAEYLGVVDDTLQFLLKELNPDLVLYDAGVDIWQDDGLGKLDISWDGIKQRDHLVFKRSLEHNTAIASVIGGGYDRDHTRLAQRHAIVIEQAAGF